jgi:peptidoglycan/xylan/chitin deacetylase (PgdA/CDA1 family)
VTEWPGGARGALCLSFDNLGEAAELELGAEPDAPLGEHFTATRVLPRLLTALREHDVPATFFVEGVNTELYPQALEAIAADGHEIAYHAWRHEQWGDLTAAEQAENLSRGIAAFEALGLSVAGLRPPGGQLGAGGVEVLREAGLRYCSPEGRAVAVDDGVALLPFQWSHVDAACVLPPMSAAREEMAGSPDPLGPDALLAYLAVGLERLRLRGGFLTVVLHPFMHEWLGDNRLSLLLSQLSSDDLWVASFADVAAHLLASATQASEEIT